MLQRTSHILVLDDSPGVCALVEAALTDIGMRVSCATTITRACQIIAEDPVDLAMVDVVLQRESGLGLAKYAMKMGARVLMMSGFADANEANMPFPFIAKPFHIRDLVDLACFLVGARDALEVAR